MKKSIYHQISEKAKSGKKQFALLIDPDKFKPDPLVKIANDAGVDFFLVGGSLLTQVNIGSCIGEVRSRSNLPVILFPGSPLQIDGSADAILFLSLISGRNPDFLIGHHVLSAPLIRSYGLEAIPTGYILVNTGNQTTAAYMSHSHPIPFDKDDIAVSTAIAGEMLGLKMIYLDGGSGAMKPLSHTMIKKVRENISAPLIAGGGIKSPEQALRLAHAGADIIVVGNAAETNPQIVKNIGRVFSRG